MKMLRVMGWTALGVGMVGAAGCDLVLSGRAEPQRVYVQERPSTVQVYVDPEPQYVVVQQAPPALIVERRPSPPGVGYIWIDGYWNWDGQRYGWQGGRYMRPPEPDVVWVAPRFEVVVGGGGHYTTGQWRRPGGNNRGGDGRGGNGRGGDNGGGRGRGN